MLEICCLHSIQSSMKNIHVVPVQYDFSSGITILSLFFISCVLFVTPQKTHFLYFAHFSLAIMTGYFHEYKSIFKSGEIGRIRDNLPVREVVGELTVRYQISIEYKSYFYGFQRNAFPPKKLFHERIFHEMLSTKCRKITMRKKQGRLGYSLLLWAYCTETAT